MTKRTVRHDGTEKTEDLDAVDLHGSRARYESGGVNIRSTTPNLGG